MLLGYLMIHYSGLVKVMKMTRTLIEYLCEFLH